MGLDMYLEARKYFSKINFRADSDEILADLNQIKYLFTLA